MATGEALGTLAFSERGTGAHFYAPELQAERSNGGVTDLGPQELRDLGRARRRLPRARPGRGRGHRRRLSRSGATSPACSFDGAWNGLGMAGNSSVALELDDVALGDDDRIGEPGRGDRRSSSASSRRSSSSASPRSTSASRRPRRAAATAHARDRRYPDGSLARRGADDPAPDRRHGHRRPRTARLLVREAARLGEAGDEAALVAIMEAKVAATEAAADGDQQALEVTGGQGYTPALPIERHLRDARAGAVMAPTNAVLRNWIGKALAGLPVP